MPQLRRAKLKQVTCHLPLLIIFFFFFASLGVWTRHQRLVPFAGTLMLNLDQKLHLFPEIWCFLSTDGDNSGLSGYFAE